MKERFVTITGVNHYFGYAPFKIGKRFKCIKEKNNIYDEDAIRVVKKGIGKVGYIANSVYTVVTGTQSASKIRRKMNKKFEIEVCFIAPNAIICKVIGGYKIKKEQIDLLPEEKAEN